MESDKFVLLKFDIAEGKPTVCKLKVEVKLEVSIAKELKIIALEEDQLFVIVGL